MPRREIVNMSKHPRELFEARQQVYMKQHSGTDDVKLVLVTVLETGSRAALIRMKNGSQNWVHYNLLLAREDVEKGPYIEGEAGPDPEPVDTKSAPKRLSAPIGSQPKVLAVVQPSPALPPKTPIKLETTQVSMPKASLKSLPVIETKPVAVPDVLADYDSFLALSEGLLTQISVRQAEVVQEARKLNEQKAEIEKKLAALSEETALLDKKQAALKGLARA